MTGVLVPPTSSKFKSDSSAVSAASGVSETTDEAAAIAAVITTTTASLLPPSSTVSVTTEGVGRMKAPPVCVDSTLKSQSVSTAELSKLVFPSSSSSTTPATTLSVKSSSQGKSSSAAEDSTATTAPILDRRSSVAITDSSHHHPIPASVSVVQASVSSCNASTGSFTRDCDIATLSDSEGKYMSESEKLNAKILQRKNSRQGRATQRWVNNDTTGGEPIRLVTGTVPILKDGKILFVSASRKPEWILPKGGWEGDESMEESAVRESFEEAGVIGILGKPLSPVKYETRKSKKRRLELSEWRQKKVKPNDDAPQTDELSSPTHKDSSEGVSQSKLAAAAATDDSLCSSIHTATAAVLSSEELAKIRSQSKHQASATADETMSVGSTLSSTYSHVQMTLFPLYVTRVMDSWPECGRFRTAMDIDDAIEIMDSRPEFKAFLQEVKSNGLHHHFTKASSTAPEE